MHNGNGCEKLAQPKQSIGTCSRGSDQNTSPMPPEPPPAPWNDFFVAVNAALQETVEVHCLGAFVATVLYGAPHETSDVDFLPLTEKGHAALLSEVGGKGSPIHITHGVYLHPVGIASLPDAYEERLIEIFPSLYTKLRLFGLDAHDLALSKLDRNSDRDQEDVLHLAQRVPLLPDLLERRYRDEMRPWLPNVERHDLTMRLWLEMIRETAG